MASYRDRYVNTEADAGGDGTTRATSSGDGSHAYQSLHAALEGEKGDISASTGSDEIIRIYCAGSSADTTPVVTNSGWTTEAGNYVHIMPDTGEEHPGYWDSSVYRLVRTNGGTIFTAWYLEYFWVDGVQVEGQDANYAFDLDTSGSGNTIRISNCLIRFSYEAGGHKNPIAVYARFAGTLKAWNNVTYLTDSFSSMGGSKWAWYLRDGGLTAYLYYNTVAGGFDYGIVNSNTSTLVLRNNLVIDSTTADYLRGADTSENNLSSDTSAPTGGTEVHNASPTFQGTDDYRLASGDTDAKEAAADVSSDANLPVDDDHIGTARDGSTPDIGANEYTSSSATYTQTLSLDAAIQATLSKTLSLDAAIQATLTTTLGLDAAVLATLTKDLGLDAAVLATLTKDLGLDAALLVEFERTLLLDAAVQSTLDTTVGLDAAVQTPYTLGVLFDAWLAYGRHVHLDAAVQKRMEATVDLSARLAHGRHVALDALVSLPTMTKDADRHRLEGDKVTGGDYNGTTQTEITYPRGLYPGE